MRKEESWRESVPERGVNSHCCLKHCSGVSLQEKSKFLSARHRCLHDQTPACPRLHLCLQSVSPAAWCFVPSYHGIYCVHSPEFLSQICFLINWYWSFKTQIKGQLLLLPQVEPITSSFVTWLYLDNLLQVSKPLLYIPIECRSWRVAYISSIISQNRIL